MGCGPSTPAVLHAQQPPATTLLLDIVRTEPETTLTLPEYESSNGGTLPVTVNGKVVASIGGRTFKYDGWSDWRKKKEQALAHVTPIKGPDGKLTALIVPDGTMIRDGNVNGDGLFQTIYSAAPRVQGLAVAMEHDGVPLYPWATVKLVWRSGGWSGVSFPIDLATPGGYEPFGDPFEVKREQAEREAKKAGNKDGIVITPLMAYLQKKQGACGLRPLSVLLFILSFSLAPILSHSRFLFSLACVLTAAKVAKKEEKLNAQRAKQAAALRERQAKLIAEQMEARKQRLREKNSAAAAKESRVLAGMDGIRGFPLVVMIIPLARHLGHVRSRGLLRQIDGGGRSSRAGEDRQRRGAQSHETAFSRAVARCAARAATKPSHQKRRALKSSALSSTLPRRRRASARIVR